MSIKNLLKIASASILLLAAAFFVGMVSSGGQVSAQVPFECTPPVANTSNCDRGFEPGFEPPAGEPANGEGNGVDNGEGEAQGEGNGGT
jgi:hypothetical protein